MTHLSTYICCVPVPLTFTDSSYSFELQLLVALTPWDPSCFLRPVSKDHAGLSLVVQELTGLILGAMFPSGYLDDLLHLHL